MNEIFRGKKSSEIGIKNPRNGLLREICAASLMTGRASVYLK